MPTRVPICLKEEKIRSVHFAGHTSWVTAVDMVIDRAEVASVPETDVAADCPFAWGIGGGVRISLVGGGKAKNGLTSAHLPVLIIDSAVCEIGGRRTVGEADDRLRCAAEEIRLYLARALAKNRASRNESSS